MIPTALARRQPPRRRAPVSFSEWDPELDTSLTWRAGDEDRLVATGAPFARKLDPQESAGLLDALDAVNGAGRTD